MPQITLYHAPNTRSFRALWLLEELGAPYGLKSINLERAEHKTPEVLALNPMGKLPTVVVDGHAVWESPAIVAHLTDLFPKSGLAPAPQTPARADFYRWLSFATAIMEPALMDHVKGHETNASQAGWGDFAAMKRALATGLDAGDWVLGPAFSGADVLIGGNLNWFSMWFSEAFADLAGLPAYLERLRARPAFKRASDIDRDLVERQSA